MSKKSNDKKNAKKAKNNTSKEEVKNNKKALENAKNEKKTKESKAIKEEIKEEIEEIIEEDIEDIEDEIDEEDEDIEEEEIIEDDDDEDEDDEDTEEEIVEDDDDDNKLDLDDDEDDEDDEDEDDDELDLDDEDEDDEDEVKIEFVENKPKKEVKEKKKKEFKFIKKEKEDKKKVEKIKVETKNSKIAKIEKKAKENKKKKSFDFNKVVDFLEDNHLVIYGFIGGVLLTTLVAFIIWPDRIAALKNGEEPIVKVDKKNYTADYLYEVMKEQYSVNLLLNKIDEDILEKIYPENDEMNEEVNSNANYYFDSYKQYYGYTQEQFLEQNGFANLEEFLNYLRLDYRRNKYLDDYITKNLTDDEINDYYKENVFGDINTQHVLVEVSKSEDDGKLSDEDAKTKAEEIINKLNDGTSWDDIKKEYKKEITFEDLGYQSWDANLEQTFMDALVDMDDNSYSENPVKTSYGYHVIYRLDQKKTPKLKEVKDIIIDNLITEKKSEDANLSYKALISLREEKNIKFSDTVMKDRYDDYCAKYK